MAQNHGIVRTIYLYLFALVGLFLFVFSTVSLVSTTLNRYVFPTEYVRYDIAKPVDGEENVISEEEQEANFIKQQDNDFKRGVNGSVPGVIIGYLLWMFHWKVITKDHKS